MAAQQTVDIGCCAMCLAKSFEILGFGGEVGALRIEHLQEIELAVFETNGCGVVSGLRARKDVLTQ